MRLIDYLIVIVSKSDFVENSNLASSKVERLLNRFVDLKFIKIVGSGRSAKHIIKE